MKKSIGRTGFDGIELYENHGQDSRFSGPQDIAQTVSATYGTRGNNQPFIVFDVRQTSESTKNERNNIYETDTSRTIDTNGNVPRSNQDGVVIIQGSMIGRDDKNGPMGNGINEDVSFTLNATDKHAVVYAIDRASFTAAKNYARNVGVNDKGINSTITASGPSAIAVPTYTTSKASFFTKAKEEVANTLVAIDYKDAPIIARKQTVSGKDKFGTLTANIGSKQWSGNQETFSGDYHILESGHIVRRLTPTECGRLQGFPDSWCKDLAIQNPTEEDIEFWADVFEAYRLAMGTSTKPKTKNQIIKWLKSPKSDSAEYKMWGNGIALPCAEYVLSAIANKKGER